MKPLFVIFIFSLIINSFISDTPLYSQEIPEDEEQIKSSIKKPEIPNRFSDYNSLFTTRDANLLSEKEGLISLKLFDYSSNTERNFFSRTEFNYRKNILKDLEFGGKFSGYYSGYEFMLVNDLSISFAYNIFKETVNRPSVSVMLEGRRFLSESFGFGYSAKVMLSKTIGELKLTLNYTYNSMEISRTLTGHNNILSGTLQYEVIKDKFFMMVEVMKDRDNYFKYGIGATFKISDGFWINAGFFRGNGNTFMIGFGFNF